MTKTSLCLLMLLAGCVSSADDHGEDVAIGDDLATNEATQDMISLNGVSLNGVSLNGISLNGTSLAGASLASIGATGASASGAVVTAKPATGQPWTTASIIGSTWTATTTTNATVKLRVDAAAASSDLWLYAVSYQTSTGWTPLCGLDASNKPIQAISVPGVWGPAGSDLAAYVASTTAFTLACRTKTIAKCVELGYKPTKGFYAQLASCVRMLRGDFCGNGVAHTVDGTTINLYDNVGVQTDTQQWPAEAEWTPAGAQCINSNNAARYELLTSKDPSCVAKRKTATCGASFANGAILIDELAPGTVK